VPNTIHVRRWIAVLVAIVFLLIGGLIGTLATAKAISGQTVPILVSTTPDRLAGKVSFQDGFAPVVRDVAGAVVNISSSRVIRAPGVGPLAPFLNDPFFRQFFGNPYQNRPQTERETSLGSGVIINPDGYVLTNNHVVEGASEIRVYLSNKKEYHAKVVGTDPRTDVAVVKLDASGLPVVKLGDSSAIQVGDFCLAIGNPFGLGQTVTSGIISATGRSGLGIEGPGAYEDFIQTDAPINPGNSGGALVDVRGELVGINTAILSGSGGSIGIGFAVPINLARQVMDQIIQHGKVTRAWMGILPQDVTPAIARAFGLSSPQGVLVGTVEPNSPAARGGVEQGDILLQMNSKPISGVNEFRIQIGLMKPGATVRFRVFRNGSQRDITVTLGEMPSSEARKSQPGGAQPSRVLQGLSVQTLTPDVARQLQIPASTRGVVVTNVAQGSLAADAGLQQGDVILQVNRKPVNTAEQFSNAVERAGNHILLLLVNRGGTTFYLTIEQE
jgi:serine protease Do